MDLKIRKNKLRPAVTREMNMWREGGTGKGRVYKESARSESEERKGVGRFR